MPIDGFDYEEFADNLVRQAGALMPDNFQKSDREYLEKTMRNFAFLAGEALYNDKSLSYNSEQAQFVVQVIAEWTFHKTVDLVNSGIGSEYWDAVMQKIAYTAFEILKQGIARDWEHEALLNAVEHHIVKVYQEAVEELNQKNFISDEILKNAYNQSNIDKLAEEPSNWLSKLKKCLKSNVFTWHREYKTSQEDLKEIKEKMQELVNPDNMYERLGVDVISLNVGSGLLQIADPDQDGLLMAKIPALRLRLTDDYGYIIPNVRIMDTSKLGEYEYSINIRDNSVARGIVNLEDKESNPVDVIIEHLQECVIKYVDRILTDKDVEKYMELVNSDNPSQINYLQEYFSVYDIRRIFVNLIRDKVSIKDICFVFMKLCEFAKETTDVDILSQKLKSVLQQPYSN